MARISALVVVFAIGLAAQQPRPTGLILGQVVDATDGRPISGAVVTMSGGMPPAPPSRTQVDAEGRFVFTDLPAGAFTLTATAGGYVDGVFGQSRPLGLSRPVVLENGQKRGDVKFVLFRTAAISGTVTDETGDPMVNAYVRVLTRVAAGRTMRLAQRPGVRTDDRGVYRIGGLTPGEYIVSVPSPTPGTGDRGPRTAARLVQPTVYFSDAASPVDAAAIAVGPGEERAGVDVHTAMVPAFQVSGALTGPEGALGNITVRLLPAALENLADEAPVEVAVTTTFSEGTFSFQAVPPGAYVARVLHTPFGGRGASALPAWGQSTLFGRMPVVVDRGDVSDLTIPVRTGPRISGRVEFSGAAPLSDGSFGRVVITLREPGGLPASYAIPPIQVGADGRFTSPSVPPGRYLIAASPPATEWTQRSADVSGRDAADIPIDVESDDVTGVIVRFFDRPGRVSGVVHDTRGAPDSSAMVYLYPADTGVWIDAGMNPRRLQTARPGPDGQYAISRLIPGDYLAVASADDPADRAAFFEAAAPFAQRVTIAEGSALTINLTTRSVR